MKNILISINPNECYKILCNKKNAMLRKNHPATTGPFHCYIYCTKSNDGKLFLIKNKNEVISLSDDIAKSNIILNRKIIAEFKCEKIEHFSQENPDIPEEIIYDKSILGSKFQFVWFISDLIIYASPKDISEFAHENNEIFKKAPMSWSYCKKIH